jgi:hypothetical protein
MKKYRIIEERLPLLQLYWNESSIIQDDIEYSPPIYYVEEKKSIFNKWKRIYEVDTIKEGEFKINNLRIEEMPFKKSIIKTL